MTTPARNIIIKLAGISHAQFQLDAKAAAATNAEMRRVADDNAVNLLDIEAQLRADARQVRQHQAALLAPAAAPRQDVAEALDATDATDPMEAARLTLEEKAAHLDYLADSVRAAAEKLDL